MTRNLAIVVLLVALLGGSGAWVGGAFDSKPDHLPTFIWGTSRWGEAAWG